MKTKSTFLFALFAVASTQAATIKEVVVRQQWPWSTDVKVEYRISDVVAPVNLTLEAFDGEKPLTIPAAAIKGDIYGIADEGYGTIIIDAKQAFGATKTAINDFSVKLTPVAAPANINEAIYKIIDIDASPMTVTDVTRAEILNGKYGSYETEYAKIGPGFNTTLSDVLIWTGVTNGDLYRTSKIALRKIPAAGQSFKMGLKTGQDGSAIDVYEVPVSFSDDYWMGVFEMTQYQLRKLRSDYTSWETNSLYADVRAGGQMTYSGHDYESRGDTAWPSKHTHSDIKAPGVLYALQQGTGLALLDLPTEAQWEFAARAGTTTDLPSGKDYSLDNYAEIGRGWHINCRPGTYDQAANYPERDCDLQYGLGKVGMYRPNAFGLYDVIGNANEQCLDASDPAKLPQGGLDPLGPDWAGSCPYVVRGGSYSIQVNQVGARKAVVFWQQYPMTGFRLCLHAK